MDFASRHTWAVSLSFLLACGGCATRFESHSANNTEAGAAPILAMQRLGLTPKNGGHTIDAMQLQEGDIILSAADDLTSAGIRLITLAPVSHAALYIGNRQIAEAVNSGVRLRDIDEVMQEESVIVAFRHPHITPAQASRMREFALAQVGRHYNHLGVMLQAPFSIERRVCELPLVPELVRDMCVRGIASIQLGAASNDRFFCSQLVLQAYREAGLPVTDADPRWLSPSDILHMRENDVPAVKVRVPLVYVGHLKYPSANAAATGSVQLSATGS
jgi:uncharacterized protein YycO